MSTKEKIQYNRKNDLKDSNYIIRLAAIFLFVILVVYTLQALQAVIVPLIFSILIAISLFPLATFFEKRLRFGKAVAAIVSVFVAIGILSGILWFIVHQTITISKDAVAIQEKIFAGLEQLRMWMEDSFGLRQSDIETRLREEANKVFGNAGNLITKSLGSISNTLTGVVMVPLYTFFLLYYRDFFKEFFFRAFKNTSNEKVNLILNKIYDVVQSYLVGLITVMGIVAVLNTGGLMLLGVDYAWFFGTLASLLMLLPYIGIAIGSILPAVFALATKDSAWYAIGVVGWFQVVQFLEANIITPNITGSKVSINPLMSILAIILGGMLFGFTGLIIALPFIATLKVLLDANEETEAFGFVIGEPEKQFLKQRYRMSLLEKWGIIPKRETTYHSEITTDITHPDAYYMEGTATVLDDVDDAKNTEETSEEEAKEETSEEETPK